MQDPQAFYQKMMSGYAMSPQAQMQQQQAIKSANQAAAASGMLGGGAEQKALADYSQQLSARDQQQWLQNMMGINTQYLGGLQDLMQRGFGAGQQMGGWTMGAGQDIGSLQNAIGQAQMGGDMAGMQGIGQLLGLLTGGVTSSDWFKKLIGGSSPQYSGIGNAFNPNTVTAQDLFAI